MQVKAPGTSRLFSQHLNLNGQAECLPKICVGVARVHAGPHDAILWPGSSGLYRPCNIPCFCSGDRLGKRSISSFRGDNACPRPCLMEAGSTCQQQPPKPTSQEPLGAVLGGVKSLLVFSLLVCWACNLPGCPFVASAALPPV